MLLETEHTRALANSLRIFASDWPDIPVTISGALTLKNGRCISCRCNNITHNDNVSVVSAIQADKSKRDIRTPAIAWASVVLPQPAGPCKRMPSEG